MEKTPSGKHCDVSAGHQHLDLFLQKPRSGGGTCTGTTTEKYRSLLNRALRTPNRHRKIYFLIGIEKSTSSNKRIKQLGIMRTNTVFMPFDAKEAQTAAHLRVQLEKAGTPIGPMDILIAATATANNAVLVTHNTREFSRVPGLILEDWY